MPFRATSLAAVSFTVVLALLVPEALLRSASGAVGGEPCGSEATPRPPSASFYRSLGRLDLLALIPWTGGRARRTGTDGAMTCLQAFTGTCGELRDEAVTAARDAVTARVLGDGSGDAAPESATDWRNHLDRERVLAFCDDWAAWRQWLTAEGLDAHAACPLCES